MEGGGYRGGIGRERGPGEMAQQLRPLTAFPENPKASSTHRSPPPLPPVPGHLMPSPALLGHLLSPGRHTQIGTHIHMNKNFEKIKLF